MKSKHVRLAVAATVMFLTACGGGGGGGGGLTLPGTTAVTGVAAKGIISKAKVLVCRIGTSIEADSNCAVGTTGPNGDYTVVMRDAWTGPVMVKIQPTDESTMLDELTNQSVKFSGFELKAVVPTAATPAHVTPYSDLAATAVVKDVAAGQPISATSVINANLMVQNTMGVDLSVKPVIDVVSDSTEMGKQLGMVLSLTKLLQAVPSLGCAQTACAIQALRDSVNSTTSVAETMKTRLSTIASQTVTTAYIPVMDQKGGVVAVAINPSDASSIATNLTSRGASSINADQIKSSADLVVSQQKNASTNLNNATAVGGAIVYTPPNTTQLTALAKAKTMVNEVRNTFNYYVNQNGTGFLDLQKKRIETDTRSLLFSNVDTLAIRTRALNLGIALLDDYNAGNGNYATGSDADGTYYYKSQGSLNNLSPWAGADAYYVTCRTPSNPISTNLKTVICANTGNARPPIWTSATTATVSFVKWIIKSTTDADHFSYTSLSHYASAIGNYGTVTAANFSTKNTKTVTTSGGTTVTLPVAMVYGGPYNYTTSGGNVLSETCLASPNSPTLTGNNETATWEVGQCINFVGSGSVVRQKVNSEVLANLTMTGTMQLTPHSQNINYRGVGYDEYAVNMTRVATSTTNVYRYRLSGSVVTREPVLKEDGTIQSVSGNVATMELPAATTSDQGTYLDSLEVTSLATGQTSYQPQTLRAKIRLTANTTSWDGILTAGDFMSDKNGNCTTATSLGFAGSFSDNSAGGTGVFINFSMTGTKSNYAQYQCQLADSPTNFAPESLNFTGKVKAPGRPDLSLIFTGTRSYTTVSPNQLLTEALNIDLSYNTAASSGSKFQFTGTSTRYPNGGSASSVILTSQDGIKLSFVQGVPKKILTTDLQELGTWSDNGVIYFKDGTFVSL